MSAPLAARINQFLATRHSPLAGLGRVFVNAGQRYGVSPLLLLGISNAESSYGTAGSDTGAVNNPFGLGHPPNAAHGSAFQNLAQAIMEEAAYLSGHGHGEYTGRGSSGPLYVGKTLPQIQQTYVGLGPSQSWVNNVMAAAQGLGEQLPQVPVSGNPGALPAQTTPAQVPSSGSTPSSGAAPESLSAPTLGPPSAAAYSQFAADLLGAQQADHSLNTGKLLQAVTLLNASRQLQQPHAGRQPPQPPELEKPTKPGPEDQPFTAPGGVMGKITMSPTADRPGVKTNPAVLDAVKGISGIVGAPLTIGTGSNHNEYVKGEGTTISDHWYGEAADIVAVGDQTTAGQTLTNLGRAALQYAISVDPKHAGMTYAQARKATGGVFNINGFNILFNTNVGGNHYNHLHVGLGRILGRHF